ncbi:MAG: acetyl-CoA decarbonylase/synthase complex subunit gamma [Candidatus Omnitrophica bacterium]|nr:acetyl-CoA decarbonylase/synthase complex subunit gamma [Candidatus Omnitrophota bacterium]
MALSGLDIYKLLPKTNCRKCGFATCLAFAMQLAKKAVTLDKCPDLTREAKDALQAQAMPPIRLIAIGGEGNKLEVGNETVMFRHEEKFHRPAGIGFIIDDDLSEAAIEDRIRAAGNLRFERIGEALNLNIIAVRQKKNRSAFVNAVKKVCSSSDLPLALMSNDEAALRDALSLLKDKRPLIFKADKENIEQLSSLAAEFKAPLVVSAQNPEELSLLAKQAASKGVNDIVLYPDSRTVKKRLWDLTQIRRQALKKNNRALGYPTLTVVDEEDAFLEAITASVFILKYSSIVLLGNFHSWEILALLTLRQNIFTDPQKPLQVAPKLYEIGQVDADSPLIVTTNFSLTYYTVLTEVEASKVPSYILSVDTEGMSVLTAWAAEKFTSESIAKALNDDSVKSKASRKEVILPGYVAVLSGKLEEDSGWKVRVGPKEASGLPAFLKALRNP